MDIKLIITDIDGVWTDGGMYYSDNRVEAKKFNTSDSVGVLLLSKQNIDMIVISGEDIPSVHKRMKKLNIKNYYLGVSDKLSLVEKIIKDRGLDFNQIAFVGDEVNDHPLLRKVGFSACPQTAPFYTKEIVDFIVPTNGGMGVFRDFVIEVLKRQDMFFEAFSKISGIN